MSALKLRCADTFICIDEVPARGVVLAGGRQTLVVLFLTVQTMVAWDTQTPVAVAHAAADTVSTGVKGAEVHQLGARGASETGRAAAAKSQGPGALRVARPVVVTGAGGTWVHLLLTCRPLVAFGTVAPGPSQAAETCGSVLTRLGQAVVHQQLAALAFIAWGASACEVASLSPLSDIGACAIVATRSAVAGVKLLTEDASVAVIAVAEESALRGLCDTFAFARTLWITEAAPGLHAAAGLYCQVETQSDLRGCGGADT